jgi:phosphatidylserine/phosphatidylglycerophosphate/cardiolipin synthase-like enzyme
LRRRPVAILLLTLAIVVACQPTRGPAGPKPIGPRPDPPLLCGGTTTRDCHLSLLGVEPDDGVGPLVRQFASARTSIEYVPFTLDHPAILGALSDARARGVQVRVLLEPAPDEDGVVGSRELEVLRGLGIDAREANPAFPLNHAKYAVIDDSRALILTFNSTAQQLSTRRDFGLVDEDPANVEFVRGLFDADWERRSLGTIPPGFAVSPDNANEVLLDLVASAKQRLDVYAEKLLPSPLLDAILDAARRNVRVRILAAPLDTSERVADALRQAAAGGQLELRVPRRPRIHAKVLLVDGATVFLGSENIQDAPKASRRELGIIFGSPEIAGQIGAVFEKDWAAPADQLR